MALGVPAAAFGMALVAVMERMGGREGGRMGEEGREGE